MSAHQVAPTQAPSRIPRKSPQDQQVKTQRQAASTLLWVSRGLLIALALTFAGLNLAGVHFSIETQSIVYLIGMVAMNLPHGGFEHANNLWNRPLSFAARYVVLFTVAIALFVGLLFWNPVLGLGLALTVAMVKGGQGGVHVLDATTGSTHLRHSLQRALAATVRGGAVMIVPMIAWPETFLLFSQYMVNIFEPGALASAGANVETVRTTLALGYGSAVLLHLGLGYTYASDLFSWGIDAAETALLVAYFTFVPVLIAVGLYFPFWYSLRQVARAVATGDDAYGSADRGEPALMARFKSGGTFMIGSLGTFGLMAGLYVLFPSPLGGAPFWAGLVAFYSIFVSIIALPHIIVGAWLDREHGIWYVP